MKSIEIRHTSDLIDFIKLDSITLDQAKKVISIALNVLIITDFTKKQLIREVESHMSKYLQNPKIDTPIFLGLDLSPI
jgi:hypothetical protein